ncbi:uncharacterized protein LOC121972418 [Zingiber officinale]|uniref:uncharacterized protein LOC121972418 n=1 Tax=Zingiber officinale TaxID=94328 RepID=UPI001C4DC9A4|nr:uncharacterized protein LOC121972418 [Zingiber officinale]
MAAASALRWIKITALVAAVATAAVAVAVAASLHRRRAQQLESRIRELEVSLAAALEKSASERRGRTRAQQALRKVLTEQNSDEFKKVAASAYPMTPIGTIRSCFSTRNGTPRQPLLVPLARACLVFDSGRVPTAALEGLAEYSHCWILYVFHLNTDFDKLWREPSRSKFKAKVRVPRLKGGKMGVLATRSPHRPCPIGLTVAKVEALDGHALLLSGVDLVDSTPVLDIKPYLPYSDSIRGATVPNWVKADNTLAVASVRFSPNFSSSLSSCWEEVEKCSLYASQLEFQNLIREVLSWDIRSLSQVNDPHNTLVVKESFNGLLESENVADEPSEIPTKKPESCNTILVENISGEESSQTLRKEEPASSSLNEVVYHLVLEGIDISYKMASNANILVEKASMLPDYKRSHHYSYSMWKDKLSIESFNT